MDNHELYLFKQLANTLHFGQTSRSCHVTPSALTRTIQRLEDELGEKLFHRDNRSVILTDAGKAFRSYADDVLKRYEELQAQISHAEGVSGDISLYCSVTAAYSILPSIFQKFRAVHPEVHINLQTGDAALALDTLQNRVVDITVAALPARLPERVEFLKIHETPLVFIAPANFPETVQWRDGGIDWENTPVILPNFGLSRERADRWFHEKKAVPNIYAQVAGNEAIIAMVALGCGVGIVPKLVVEKSPLQEQIKVLSVTPEMKPFLIGICTMKKIMRLPQVQAFWEIAVEVQRCL